MYLSDTLFLAIEADETPIDRLVEDEIPAEGYAELDNPADAEDDWADYAEDYYYEAAAAYWD